MDYAALKPQGLVKACLQTGDELAWREFVRRFHPLISRVVVRVARRWGEKSPQVIDDLIQDTYLKLCSGRLDRLGNFEPTHDDAIFGYLRVFTANLVHDHFKASHSDKRGGGTHTSSLDSEQTMATRKHPISTVEQMDRGVLIKEVETCLRSLDSSASAERDRRIFWLYYRIGLPASEIAALPEIGLSTKGVESTLFRLTRQVRQHLVSRKQNEVTGESSKRGIRRAESL